MNGQTDISISICLLASGAKTYCGRDRPEGEFFAFNRQLSTCERCNEIHDLIINAIADVARVLDIPASTVAELALQAALESVEREQSAVKPRYVLKDYPNDTSVFDTRKGLTVAIGSNKKDALAVMAALNLAWQFK